MSFCLIDVDLYRPVKTALEKIVPMVEPGGIVVVDDCQQHSLWDGAFEAYAEFAAREQLQLKIVEGQFGMIEIKG